MPKPPTREPSPAAARWRTLKEHFQRRCEAAAAADKPQPLPPHIHPKHIRAHSTQLLRRRGPTTPQQTMSLVCVADVFLRTFPDLNQPLSARAFHVLAQAAEHDDFFIRNAALNALAPHIRKTAKHPPQILENLASRLLSHTIADVRRDAIAYFAAWRTHPGVRTLLRKRFTEDKLEIRMEAAKAFAAQGPAPKDAAFLIRLLRQDPHRHLHTVARALRNQTHRPHVQILLCAHARALWTHERKAGDLHQHSVVLDVLAPHLRQPIVRGLFQTELRHHDPYVRHIAVEKLVESGRLRDADHKRLRTGPDPSAKAVALIALAPRAHRPRTADILLGHFNHPSGVVSEAAADALAAAKTLSPSIRHTLLRLLKDRDARRRAAAVRALAPHSRHPTIRAALFKRFSDPDPNVTDALVGAAEHLLAEPKTAELIRRKLRNPDPYVRRTAVQILFRTPKCSQNLRRTLLQSLADPNGDVRKAVFIEFLMQLPRPLGNALSRHFQRNDNRDECRRFARFLIAYDVLGQTDAPPAAKLLAAIHLSVNFPPAIRAEIPALADAPRPMWNLGRRIQTDATTRRPGQPPPDQCQVITTSSPHPGDF